MKTERVMFLGLHRHGDAGGGLVPGYDSGEEGVGRCIGHGLGKREGSGVHGGAQMDGSTAVRVVLFNAVRGCSIGHRGKARNGA
jgi:hypothetical protein